jgi:hypothetical protein
MHQKLQVTVLLLRRFWIKALELISKSSWNNYCDLVFSASSLAASCFFVSLLEVLIFQRYGHRSLLSYSDLTMFSDFTPVLDALIY